MRLDEGDYILIGPEGEVEAISGNADFWDVPDAVPREMDAYIILQVTQVVGDVDVSKFGRGTRESEVNDG